METNIKSKIDYKLRKAKNEDKELLISYKLATIFAYADNLDKKEIDKINNYVLESIKEEINDYKVIEIDNKVIGSLLVRKENNEVLLDEIYIEEKYRGLGIGSKLIREILNKHSVVYLWVYKENTGAIKLYSSLGFKIIEETETRYRMKYEG